MNEYVQIEFPAASSEQKDILIARLADNGYEGFEETENGLKAFICLRNFEESVLQEITAEYQTGFIKTVIKETNWNKLWESNFEPVIIDDFAGIRASFHPPIGTVRYEMVITPKMSFGTGHHATTLMMIREMRQIGFEGKTVLDFGTGTGVLAILGEKLGAKEVTAIDNDQWSVENANENIKINSCRRIELQKADRPPGNKTFDIILANINRNVILDSYSLLASQLAPCGTLLLSGLLTQDEDVIFRKTSEYSLHIIQTTVRDNWLCLRISC